MERPRLAGFRLVSLWTLVSRILGYARDSAMAAVFGLGPILDAFTVAFRIPNLARSLFGEGALTTAFLPAYVAEARSGPEASRSLTTAVFVRLLVILATIVTAAELLLLAARFALSPSEYQLRLIDLLAIMTPYLLLICLTALASAVLQAQRRFLWPAVVPVMLNGWWLAAVAVVTAVITDPESRIRWIAAALLIGGVLQLMVPVAALIRSGHGPVRDHRPAADPARAVFRAMLPTLAATSIAQFNTVLDSFLAWFLAEPIVAERIGNLVVPGTAAAIYCAQRLYQFPLGMIGVAAGTVLYPALAAHAAAKEFHRLKDDLTHGLCVALSIAIPASAGLVVLAGPIVDVLFLRGRFDSSDALLTTRVTAIYGSVVWSAIALMLVQRGFFAVGDRRTPLRTGLAAAAVNILLTPLGVWWGGGLGLATATASTSLFHLALSLWIARAHQVSLVWPTLLAVLGRTVLATAAMTAIILGVRIGFGGTFGRYAELLASLIAGTCAFFAAAKFLGLHEPFELLFRRRAASTIDVPQDEDPPLI